MTNYLLIFAQKTLKNRSIRMILMMFLLVNKQKTPASRQGQKLTTIV